MLARQSEMTAREPKAIVAYWVTPAEPTRSFFASTIAELAARFDAPLFEPHVTIYATREGEDIPGEVLSRARSIQIAHRNDVLGLRSLVQYHSALSAAAT